MRLRKIFILFVVIILTSFSFIQKDSFSFYYGNKVFMKGGQETVYLYKGVIKRLYFGHTVIDIKLEKASKDNVEINFISENKLVLVLPDNSTRVVLKNSPRVLYLSYSKRSRKKSYSIRSVYLNVRLGEKNKNFADDPLKIKRVKLANYLARIHLMGGDHLKYSEKMLRYLREKHNIAPTEEGFHKRYSGSWWRRRRRGSVDLYSLLSGGLAIRESLQTETIRPIKMKA